MGYSDMLVIVCQTIWHLIAENITYFLEQSPSRAANRFSASQEILRILWNVNVHYHIHKCPPPVHITEENKFSMYRIPSCNKLVHCLFFAVT